MLFAFTQQKVLLLRRWNPASLSRAWSPYTVFYPSLMPSTYGHKFSLGISDIAIIHCFFFLCCVSNSVHPLLLLYKFQSAARTHHMGALTMFHQVKSIVGYQEPKWIWRCWDLRLCSVARIQILFRILFGFSIQFLLVSFQIFRHRSTRI